MRLLIRNISLNTLQVLVNQFLGVFIFLLLSRYLDKDSYGELNWSMAVLTCVVNILSLRLEQVVVRNVAAGRDPSAMLTLFLLHNLVVGMVFFAALLTAKRFFPVFFMQHPILWVLSISQLLGFFALPFRQLTTGKSAFGWLAVLASLSNGIRCIVLLWMAIFSSVTLTDVLWLFTISAGAEFLLGLYIVVGKMRIPIDRRQNFSDYTGLIRDSFPQVGLVFLQAGLARIDWILLGIFSTPAHTAEYSFAYRAYEISPLPLLVLAPFLLNYFAKEKEGHTPSWLNGLVRLEMIFATLLPLWAVLAWAPLVDMLTQHKYGSVNAFTFLILSCSIPFQYLINVYWTAEFAANRLGKIFFITAVTCGVVLLGDILLIPRYAGQGAAIAWLVAMVVQYLLYSRRSFNGEGRQWVLHLIGSISIAVIAGEVAIWLTPLVLARLGIASLLYGLLSWGGALVV